MVLRGVENGTKGKKVKSEASPDASGTQRKKSTSKLNIIKSLLTGEHLIGQKGEEAPGIELGQR